MARHGRRKEIRMTKLPLRTGPEIDWRSKCHPGDSQGETDACAVFALANWVECMTGNPITDAEAIECWRAERQFRYGNLDGGLQITEAFAAAMIRTRWLPHGTTIRRVSNLDTLPLAPLVAAISGLDWAIKPDTGLVSRAKPGTNHAVLAAADIEEEIWIENSHGPRWGENGFGRMTHDTFARHCVQIWQIILPGAAATIDEQATRQAEELAGQIGDKVRSIARNLDILGYQLPGDSRTIMADIIRRSMAGQLTPAQNDARRDVTDVYLILSGSGITDAQINAVWDVINK
jgi:hypothetical protein